MALVGVGDLGEKVNGYLMVKKFSHETDVDATVKVIGLLGDILVDGVGDGRDSLFVYCCLSVGGVGGDELPVLCIEGNGVLS